MICIINIYICNNRQQIETSAQVMQAISKQTLKQYKQILNLPYTNLLQQITTTATTTIDKPSSKPIHKQYDILALSAKHQCPYLFQLSLNQQINQNTNTNTNINNQDNLNCSFKNQWMNITKAGLKCLFRGDKEDVMVGGMGGVGKYFQRVRHQFVESNEEKTNTNYTQLMTYWMPTIFDASGSSFKEIQTFKQDYMTTLDFMCKMFDRDLSSIGVLDYIKLFPAQIFNVSDQPLIKNVYMKHIYPNLCQQFNHIHKNGAIAWLSRLGLSSDQYIIKSLTHDLSRLQSKVKISEQQAIINQLEIANELFIILRKMSFTTPNPMISSLIRSIWHKLSFDVVLRNTQVSNNDQLASIFVAHLQKLVKISQKWSIKQHQKISNIFLKLSLNNPIPSSSQVTPKILLLHEYRIIRYLLLSIHINLHSNTTQQTTDHNHNKHQQKYLVLIKNLFNSQYVFKLIQKYIYVGDLLPELFYANEIYRLIARQNIFSSGSQLQMLLDTVRKQYKQVIDKINNKSNFCEEQGISWSRYDNIQNILSGCSRLTYCNLNQNLKTTTKTQTIVKSLLNDIQFCCRFMYPSTSKLIRDNIEADLRLKITEQNNYPFFSEMEVHDMANTNRRQIYMKKNLGRIMRTNISKNPLLLDVTNMGELEKKIGKIKLRNWL